MIIDFCGGWMHFLRFDILIPGSTSVLPLVGQVVLIISSMDFWGLVLNISLHGLKSELMNYPIREPEQLILALSPLAQVILMI